MNEQGKISYIYKRKHNISNDPNKRKSINKNKEKLYNYKTILIIILFFVNFIFWYIFWSKRQKKHNNIDNNLNNIFLVYNNGYIS